VVRRRPRSAGDQGGAATGPDGHVVVELVVKVVELVVKVILV